MVQHQKKYMQRKSKTDTNIPVIMKVAVQGRVIYKCHDVCI